MLFETVNAFSFGALKSAELRLAPGLNVVWGPNEAGKSTWHAAVYAGLCGMARGRGGIRKQDEDFQLRHSPWDGDAWEVGATIRLHDERRIILRHDLAGKVDCAAMDADLGTDYSNEVIYDGAPDGSRWLGLDRRSFLATACIRQAELLAVLEEPGLLQQYVERAADTAGADATAAGALDRLRKFHTDHVGTDRKNSVKPLGRATRSIELAAEQLEAARRDHQRFVSLAERVAEQEQKVSSAENRLKRAQLEEAVQALREAEDRIEAGRKLAERYPEGPPVVDLGALDRAGELEMLLASWRSLSSSPPELANTSAPLAVLTGVLLLVLGLAGLAIGLGPWSLVVSAAGIAVALLSLRRTASHDARDPSGDLKAALHEATRDLGIQWSNDDSPVHGLESWISQVRTGVSVHNEEVKEYQDLAARKGVATAQDLELTARELRERVEALEAEVGAPIESPEPGSAAELQRQLMAVTSDLDQLRGERSAVTSLLTSVAVAEERLTDAQDELARVERLGRVLDLTGELLAKAQQQMHHEIAPVLASSVRGRLSAITHGRYDDVIVDPKTLAVKARDGSGRWRAAELLSHGTAEQIYLLLRVALAEHLTRPDEVCPLILDDVTAHSDDERTVAVLNALQTISGDRQVIVFSQETRVREWAEEHLTYGQDKLEILMPIVRAGN